jgi:putative transcriptional regulator
MADGPEDSKDMPFGDPLAFDPVAHERFMALVGEGPARTRTLIQQKRHSTGLSQDEFAAAVGVSRQTISSIENRRTTPSVRLALAIAAMLRTSVEELFAEEQP